MKQIYLEKKDLDNLKIIGKGTESIVYKKNINTLYKIYIKPLSLNENQSVETSEIEKDIYGVKINDKTVKEYNNYEPYPYYLESNGIKKIYDENVIYEAIKRQKNIKYSTLPLAPIYLDNKFSGCILKKHNFCTDLHETYLLPIKKKLDILKQLLEKVKELTDNNIYCCDLDNYKRNDISHSNILINVLNLNTNIIDLDGKSTIYSGDYNEDLNNYCYKSFSSLIMQYLYDVDLYDEIMPIEYDYIINEIIKHTKLDHNTIIDLFDFNYNTYDKNKLLLEKIKRA